MDVVDVSIDNILHDAAMYRWVKQNICDRQQYSILKHVKRIPHRHDGSVGELVASKIDCIEKTMLESSIRAISPIRIKIYKHTGYFEILDGRHRVVLAIKYNMETVPCIVVTD